MWSMQRHTRTHTHAHTHAHATHTHNTTHARTHNTCKQAHTHTHTHTQHMDACAHTQSHIHNTCTQADLRLITRLNRLKYRKTGFFSVYPSDFNGIICVVSFLQDFIWKYCHNGHGEGLKWPWGYTTYNNHCMTICHNTIWRKWLPGIGSQGIILVRRSHEIEK